MMKKITYAWLLACIFGSVLLVEAQERQKLVNASTFELTEENQKHLESYGTVRCATVENEARLQQEFPNRISKSQFEEWLAPIVAKIKTDRAAGRAIQAVYTIPVVVHVIHNGDQVNTSGSIYGENISDAQVLSQINVMNQDYRRMAGTPGGANTTGLAVDVEINFCLAQTDPNGNATTGIVRHNIAPYNNNVADGPGGPDWESRPDVEAVKMATQWDPTNYLNMWTLRFGGLPLNQGGNQGLLGYAQLPDATGTGVLGLDLGLTTAANTDGVTASFSTFGDISDDDGSFIMDATYNKGRTMTHEVGHWLGLRHIWGDGPLYDPPTNTTGSCVVDDFCADTPNARGANYGCGTPADNCGGGVEQIQNYMDYSDDICMDTFTQDQKDRMVAIMQNSPRRMELNNSIRCQAPTPYVEFVTPTSTIQEGTDCGYTDYAIEVSIIKAPSADATVTFNVTGGSGTNNTDYEVINNPVIFPSGSSASQNLTIRVYNDGLVEGDETINISMALSTSGDALLNTGKDSTEVTITDDDNVPVAVITTDLQDYDFEDFTGLGLIDADGDGQNFIGANPVAFGGLAGQWMASVVDPAVIGGSGSPYNPDNYLIFPEITIPAGTQNVDFTFEIGTTAVGGEHYAAYFAPNATSTANILAGTLLEDRVSIGGGTETHTVSSNSIAGQTGSFVIRHFNQISNTLLVFDTLNIDATTEVGVQTAQNSGTPDQNALTTAGTIYTKNDVDGSVMLDITNNDGANYGCVDTSVSRAYNAGTPTVQYESANTADYVMSKTFDIIPVTTNGAGNATLKFYFTEAEIAAWETATGNSRNDLIVIKDNGGTPETASATIGSFGANVTLTASYGTGIRGTYYFGTMNTLTVAENQFTLFDIYPNPSSGNVNIILDSDDTVSVSLYDIRGRLVYKQLFNNNNGTFNRELDFNTLASGVYLLNVESGIKKGVKKLLIQ